MTKLNPHDKHKLIEELCSRPNTQDGPVKNQKSNEQMTKLNPHDKHKLIEELCSRPNTQDGPVKNQNSFENFSILQKIDQYNEHWLMNSVKLLKEINDPDNGFSVGKFEINTKLFDPTFFQDAPDREISEKMSA